MKHPNHRKDRMIKETQHDSYLKDGKWPEPTFCPECKALFTEGRWTWKKPVPDANEAICPACKRIADHYPAGYLELRGAFIYEHIEEIMRVVRNIEQQEKEAHPIERIMEVVDHQDHFLVTTTGIHVARRIGDALARAYKGVLTLKYADAADVVRIYWQR